MTSGSKLASLRKKRKLGQSELARILGVSRSFICKLESNKKLPSCQFVDRLHAALELTHDERQQLLKAAALGQRRIHLGRHLDHERVEIIHLFVDRIQGLECAPLRALLEAMPTR